MLLNMYNNKYFTIYLFTHIYNLFPCRYFPKFKKKSLHPQQINNLKPFDRIRAIIRMHPLVTDTQRNTLDW